MRNHERFRVHADLNTIDPRARKLKEQPVPHDDVAVQYDQPKRGEVVRQFLEQTARADFSQYPRLQEAFGDVQQALENLGLTPDTLRSALTEIFIQAEDSEYASTVSSMGEQLRERVLSVVGHQLGIVGERDQVRFSPLEAALKSLYRRALEVLAVFQKQERQHTASHRAHSSKIDGEFAFGGPELSIWALETAMKQGVRNIEIDVTALADGTPVVTHNLSASTSEGKKKIGTIPNLAEADALDATIDRTGARMYGLEDLLTIAEKYRGLARLNLEIKDAAAVPQVVELIRRHGLERDIMVSSFNPQVVLDVHAALPEVTLGVNSFVMEHNVDTILAEPKTVSKPWVLPGGVAVGGNQLPDALVNYATYQTLPPELRQALRDTEGYLTVQVPLAKLGFGLDKVKQLAARAKQEGIKLLMFRVSPKQAAILREVDALHLDKGEELTYPRMGKSLHPTAE